MLKYNARYLEKPISFIAIPHGKDYAISVMGGDEAHIGAIAFCAPGSAPTLHTLAGHREGEMAVLLAEQISLRLNCSVSVSAGIHYDKISSSQINDIIEIVMNLKNQFLTEVATG